MTTTASKQSPASDEMDAIEPDTDQGDPSVPAGNLVDPPRKTLGEKISAYCSRLSTKNNFWHRFFSWIYLPIAFKSGIKMKKLDSQTFAAVLPFRRFNKNWYN
ncbi:MAG: hypothetical protein KDA21_12695, partial [Phycisphaerales bacterium]|nr:hypothetical protein [Phycisphaerales bacterium]